MNTQRGVTLVELTVTLAVLAVLVAMSLPSFQRLTEKRRVIGAAEQVYETLLYAKNESIKRSLPLVVSFSANNSTDWAIGVTDSLGGCDAAVTAKTDASACTIEYDNDPDVDDDGDGDTADPLLIRYASTDFPGVTLTGTAGNAPSFGGPPGRCASPNSNEVCFDPFRGTARNGTIVTRSADHEVRVVVSRLGRVRLCSPEGTTKVPGYQNC